jgi:integrase
VPIPPEVYRELQKWRELSKSDSILVFPSERTGRVMWPGTWPQKRIKALALKVGIKNVNFLTFTHKGVEAVGAHLVNDCYGEIVKAGRSAKRPVAGSTAIQ